MLLRIDNETATTVLLGFQEGCPHDSSEKCFVRIHDWTVSRQARASCRVLWASGGVLRASWEASWRHLEDSCGSLGMLRGDSRGLLS